MLALGEGKSGKRAYLGAVLSPNKSETAWVSLLEPLEIPEAGRGLIVVHDGDHAIASALGFILPKAESRLCAWHQIRNVFLKARELFLEDRGKVKEAIDTANMNIETAQPKTTSPSEREIKEYRRRTWPMDGVKSFKCAANFLRIWLVKRKCQDGKRGLA